jgi:tRNA U38,U39,U40 pseudouridine synthase TruA
MREATLARMDWQRVRQRRIALKVAYFGANYAGFALQANAPSVEGVLLDALHQTCLTPSADPDECNYTRCGRTDRGVSALSQVVALDLRSNFPFARERVRAAGVAPTDPTLRPLPEARTSAWSAAQTEPRDSPYYVPRVKGLLPPPNAGAEADADAGTSAGAGPAAGAGASAGASKAARKAARKAATAAAAVSGTGVDADADAETETCAGSGAQDKEKLHASFAAYMGGQTYRLSRSHVRAEVARERAAAEGAGTTVRVAAEDFATGPAVADPDEGVPESDFDAWADAYEVDYCTLLNGRLPADVRVVAWAPVCRSFSARFSCDSRTYKYLFYADGMDLAAMQRAAQLLRGTHDFRNLCHMDVAHVTHFTRRVCDAVVRPCALQDAFYAPPCVRSAAAAAAAAASDADASEGARQQLPADSVAPSSAEAQIQLAPPLALPTGARVSAPKSGQAAAAAAGGSWAPLYRPENESDYGQLPPLSVAASHAATVPVVTTSGVALASVPGTHTLRPGRGGAAAGGAVLLPSDTLCEFVVTGEAFLYHQVRCMIAVLFLVGRGLERPEIVSDLLDITKVRTQSASYVSFDLFSNVHSTHPGPALFSLLYVSVSTRRNPSTSWAPTHL